MTVVIKNPERVSHTEPALHRALDCVCRGDLTRCPEKHGQMAEMKSAGSAGKAA